MPLPPKHSMLVLDNQQWHIHRHIRISDHSSSRANIPHLMIMFHRKKRNDEKRKLELEVKDKKNQLNQRTYLACSKLHNSNRKVRSFPSIQGNPRQCKAHSWRSTRHSIGQSYPHQQRRHLHTSWLKANGS